MALSEGDLIPGAAAHRIGPNAVTRVAEVLRLELPAVEVARLFDLAGIARHLDEPPEHMVDEREVTALHRVLRAELGVPRALAVAREAGVRTGDYLLARRIPKPAQVVLRLLPAPLASRMLIRAIARSSWTFSGSGVLRTAAAYPPRLAIAGCCVCRGETSGTPLCDYYAAVIEHLFRALVQRGSRVTETTCQARGADACTFEIRW